MQKSLCGQIIYQVCVEKLWSLIDFPFGMGKMRVVLRDESMTPSCIDDSKISHEITDGRAECLNDIHVVHEEL